MGNAKASIQRHVRNMEFPAFIKDWHGDTYVSLCEKSFLQSNRMQKVSLCAGTSFFARFCFHGWTIRAEKNKI